MLVSEKNSGDKTYNVLFAQAFNDALGILDRRIALFLALPLDKLDAIAIKHRIDEIGAEPGARA
jgi:hypothetical protein